MTESTSDLMNDDVAAPLPMRGPTLRQSRGGGARKPEVTENNKPHAAANERPSLLRRILSTASRKSSNAGGGADGRQSTVNGRQSSLPSANGGERIGITTISTTGPHSPPSRDPPPLPDRTYRTSQPTPRPDRPLHRLPTDPLPGHGPERPRQWGQPHSYVFVPPKLHREPRGWAPASHAVPAVVKRTWGRANARMTARQNDQPDLQY